MEIKLLIENKVNEAYLRMIFKAKKSEAIKIHRNNDIGKYISSRVRHTSTIQTQTIGTILLLPNKTNSAAKSNFSYFTIEDQDKINDYIYADYKLWLKTAMVIATDDLKFSKSDAIESIIDQLKMRNDPTFYENLRKYEYRRRSKIKKFLRNTLQCLSL